MRRLRNWLVLGLFGVVAFAALGASECDTPTENNPNADSQRAASVETRTQTFDRAEKAVGIPRPVNFPLRKALVEKTMREDDPNRQWYTYILGDAGNVVGYYVTKTPPVNSCNFLSSTEDVRTYQYNGNLSTQVLTAPSLDGIFYGGSGASAGCDSWFFFDVSSDAMITIRGVHFFTTDKPLNVKAEAISVAPEKR